MRFVSWSSKARSSSGAFTSLRMYFYRRCAPMTVDRRNFQLLNIPDASLVTEEYAFRLKLGVASWSFEMGESEAMLAVDNEVVASRWEDSIWNMDMGLWDGSDDDEDGEGCSVTRFQRSIVSSDVSEIEVLVLSPDSIHLWEKKYADGVWSTQLTRLGS